MSAQIDRGQDFARKARDLALAVGYEAEIVSDPPSDAEQAAWLAARGYVMVRVTDPSEADGGTSFVTANAEECGSGDLDELVRRRVKNTLKTLNVGNWRHRTAELATD